MTDLFALVWRSFKCKAPFSQSAVQSPSFSLASVRPFLGTCEERALVWGLRSRLAGASEVWTLGRPSRTPAKEGSAHSGSGISLAQRSVCLEKKKMVVLGIVGPSRSGKSVVADLLVKHCKAQRIDVRCIESRLRAEASLENSKKQKPPSTDEPRTVKCRGDCHCEKALSAWKKIVASCDSAESREDSCRQKAVAVVVKFCASLSTPSQQRKARSVSCSVRSAGLPSLQALFCLRRRTSFCSEFRSWRN